MLPDSFPWYEWLLSKPAFQESCQLRPLRTKAYLCWRGLQLLGTMFYSRHPEIRSRDAYKLCSDENMETELSPQKFSKEKVFILDQIECELCAFTLKWSMNSLQLTNPSSRLNSKPQNLDRKAKTQFRNLNFDTVQRSRNVQSKNLLQPKNKHPIWLLAFILHKMCRHCPIKQQSKCRKLK